MSAIASPFKRRHEHGICFSESPDLEHYPHKIGTVGFVRAPVGRGSLEIACAKVVWFDLVSGGRQNNPPFDLYGEDNKLPF
jgi:hypothetical protein